MGNSRANCIQSGDPYSEESCIYYTGDVANECENTANMASVNDVTITGEFYGDGSRCIRTSSVGTI